MSATPPEPVRGPLDQLFPGLRVKPERIAPLPVHPRVVHAREPSGRYAIALASFAPATSLRAYHAALKPLVEAALLNELCRSVEVLADDHSALASLELYCFAEQPFDVRNAHAAFALSERAITDLDARYPLALVRAEASSVVGAEHSEPRARWVADVVRSPHPLASALEEHLRAHAPKLAWGREPGVLARLAADFLAAHGHAGVEPSRAGIEALEAVCVHLAPFALRHVGAASFQALCDLIAVFAASHDDLDVAWGVCEADDGEALVPPPVLRVARGEDTWHVPLGEHVLRWSVMPTAPGEAIPTLGAWAEHEFA